MRLHSLSVTAFGPFADTVRVDFDALTEAQVFLLCGDIGAGKTTVLDAVCFALYGDVPTDRGRARQLRSHFAADGVAPRVVLEASVSGRRLRFTRSPAWERPKKRGTGTTTAQASALVEESAGGSWLARATRLDEAGQLVSDLLGMTLPQFSQVVMLPQGQFDTFLRASSEDRQRVLTRLFRTHRFEAVERWLTERRSSLRRDGEARAAEVVALLHRTSEAAGVDLPAWEPDLATAVDDEQVAGWVSDLQVVAELDAARAETERENAAAALEAAVAADTAARRNLDLRARHRRAAVRRDELDRSAQTYLDDQHRLGNARRAALVRAPWRAACVAAADAEAADVAAGVAVGAVADLLDDEPPSSEVLERRAVAAAERAAVAAGFVPRARDLVAAQAHGAGLAVRLDALTVQRARLAERAVALPGDVAALETDVVSLRDTASREDVHRAAMVGLARRLSRFAVRTELEFQVADFTTKRDEQQVRLLDLRQRQLDLREMRLHGMAAELASAMAVGGSCPVCGSCEHPDPAAPEAGAPDEQSEQQVQSALDDVEVLLETHRDQVRSYSGRLAVVAEELGDATEEQTVAGLESAQAALTATQRAGRDLVDRERDLAQRRTTLAEVAALLAELDADLAVCREQLESCERTQAQLSAELAAILGPQDDPGDPTDAVASLSAAARHDRRSAALLAAARDALTEQSRQRGHASLASSLADDVAGEQGFDSPAAAAAAELPDDVTRRLAAEAVRRTQDEAEVHAVLADPEMLAALADPELDGAALDDARRRATARHASAATAADLATRRRDRLAAQATDLETALAAWAPARAEYVVVRSLSELAEGKGADNTVQMRLSAYVLAARLSQVVAAANERLTRMTDGRYLLRHTSQRGVGERRGGLSLVVHDLWTDVLRDPVTLSGGETFVVSLALALGLADVVTAEAGGLRVDTLFVDEGFGSLDGDALELVMDTLDELRSGGRVVGVVSHVPELRTRIPAQLVVSKGRSGSSLHQAG